MRRRSFVQGLSCLVLTSWAADVGAQTATRMPKVGFLSPSAPGDMDLPTDLVRAALTSLGYVDGQTITIEIRFAGNRLERLPALAAELVAARPDVIHTFSSAAIHALAAATSTVPIVVAPVTEATLAEFVSEPSHPKGNITGLTLDSREQSEKCLQLLKEAAPHWTACRVSPPSWQLHGRTCSGPGHRVRPGPQPPPPRRSRLSSRRSMRPPCIHWSRTSHTRPAILRA